jgi:hypothetical protein
MNDEPKSDGDENCANGRDIVKLHDPVIDSQKSNWVYTDEA